MSQVVNETLAAGKNINDGTLIARNIDNRTFTLPSGQRHVIDNYGERKADIHSIIPAANFRYSVEIFIGLQKMCQD